MTKVTIYKQTSQPGDPGIGWVVENGPAIFVTPTFADACDYVRMVLGDRHGECSKCRECGAEIMFCAEPITGFTGWAVCGSHENSVDAFYCDNVHLGATVHVPTPGANVNAREEVAQAWAEYDAEHGTEHSKSVS